MNVVTSEGGDAISDMSTAIVSVGTSTTAAPSDSSYLLPTPLSLRWSFGFSSSPSSASLVHSLTTPTRSAVLYSSSHFSVLHDLDTDRQRVLQGHVHSVSASLTTKDKRFVITADDGGRREDSGSVLIVWDADSGVAVKVLNRRHGVQCMDVSDDGMFIAVVDNASPQRLSIYEWNALTAPSTDERPSPAVAEVELPISDAHCVRFHPTSLQELVLNSATQLLFARWQDASISLAPPAKSARRLRQLQLTQSAFIPYTTQAVTATQSGHVLVWDFPSPTSSADPSQQPSSSPASPPQRSLAKSLKLLRTPISLLSTLLHRYLVLSCADGTVRFFDFQFRIVAWFDDVGHGMGGITAVSFDDVPLPSKAMGAGWGGAGQAGGELGGGGEFAIPPFIIATSTGKIVALHASLLSTSTSAAVPGSRAALLLASFDAPLSSLHAHPALPLFATSTVAGTVSIWDADERRLVGSRTLYRDGSAVSLVRFSPHGNMLAVGLDSGEVRLLDTEAIASTSAEVRGFLGDVALFRQSRSRIAQLSWSPCSTFLASADADCNVSLYRYWHQDDVVTRDKEWSYIGRYRAHYGAVVALLFSPSSPSAAAAFPHDPRDLLPPLLPPTLHSLGQDRSLQQYDLSASSIRTGLRLKATFQVEESALPTAMLRMRGADLNAGRTGAGRLVDDDSDVLLVANDEYKLRVWELIKTPAGACELKLRRTVLAPTFCGGITALSTLPAAPTGALTSADAAQSPYLLFASSTASLSSYLGVLSLPLLGHPDTALAILAHPASALSSFSAAFDGASVFSFAPQETAVKQWRVDAAQMPRRSLEPASDAGVWAALLEEERGAGEPSLVQRVDELMLYCEVQAEGDDRREQRRIRRSVPLSDLPTLCSALGCYLSQRQLRDMADEADHRHLLEGRPHHGRLTRDEFVRLLLNHRPVLGVGREQIEGAFDAVRGRREGEGGEKEGGGGGEVDTEELVRLLMTEGERMSAGELMQCLDELLGEGQGLKAAEEEKEELRSFPLGGDDAWEVQRVLQRLPKRMSPETFASALLGFADYQ